MKRGLSAISAFFFAPESARMLATVRIAGGLVLLYEAVRHWPYAVELYSTAGPAFPKFAVAAVPGPFATAALASLHLAATITLLVGWQTRTSALLTLFLSLWLWPLDAAGTFAKYSVLMIHLLALLACSGAGRAWATDALLYPAEVHIPAWPRRLMQFLVCSVYLSAALTKLKMPGFVNGDLLMFSLLDEHWGADALGQRLVLHPQAISVLSQLSLVIELLFPFLIWVRECRLFLLAGALVMHGVMGLLMHVGIFSPVMVTLLLAFLEERDFARMRSWFGRSRRSAGAAGTLPSDGSTDAAGSQRLTVSGVVTLWSWSGVALAWAIVTVVGTSILWWDDKAEVFGNRPATPLRQLSRDEVEVRLVQQQPAFEDYFHRIELGSRFNGNQTFGRRDSFPRGSTVYMLVQAIPSISSRRPSMSLEVLLLDPDGRDVRRASVTLDSSANYVVLAYELASDFEAGEYRLVLQAEGVDVWQRRFNLSP